MAWTTATNSTRLEVITATRSPGPTPCADQVAGEGVGEAVEVAEGPALVAGPDGIPIAEPVRGPLEAAVHQGRGRVGHGNIVLRW